MSKKFVCELLVYVDHIVLCSNVDALTRQICQSDVYNLHPPFGYFEQVRGITSNESCILLGTSWPSNIK